MNESQAPNESILPCEILRHRAAIRRKEFSRPLKCLLKDNLLRSNTTFFDFGCGYGDDIEQARRLGFVAHGWDPAYRPDAPIVESEIVNLGYVINVIENQAERMETLRAAWNITKRLLVVSARIVIDGTGDGDFEFGDGVITKIQTFQKFYTQIELRAYLEKTLKVEPISAAPGVFYVFKDSTLRESFSASKCQTRSFAPRQRAQEIEFERHRDLLEELIHVSAQLARLPLNDEFPRTNEIVAQLGSMKRAFGLIKKVTGADPWDSLRQVRIDDLRVYMALASFPHRPSLSKLPPSIQRDIKVFFGSYKNACESANMLLFDSGNSDLIDAACQRSPIGRLTTNALLLHRSAISSLEPILRVLEGCARAYLGEIEDTNIIKLHRYSGKVSYLACPKFDSHPHPPITRTITLSLRNLHLKCSEHTESKNLILLDRKEQMIEKDHPLRPRFSRFTLQELRHGMFDKSEDLLTALQWYGRLQNSGLNIRGYRLLYKKGVKKKRLSPKSLFGKQESDSTSEASIPPQDIAEHSPSDCITDEDTNLDHKGRVKSGKNRFSGLPQRSRRYGVGKEIGDAVYIHHDYEQRLGDVVEWAKRHLPQDFDYAVVKLNKRNDTVSFIQCPEFNTDHEPAILAVFVVHADGQVQHRSLPADPYIYHHKWLFVADDYAGFDVAASKERSQLWMKLIDIDRSRIGRKNFWKQHVEPRLLDLEKTQVSIGTSRGATDLRFKALI